MTAGKTHSEAERAKTDVPGPAWRAAEAAGIDMALVELSLQKTPWERMADHDQALAEARLLREAVRKQFRIEDLKNVYLSTDLGVLDCLGEVTGIGPYEAVKRQSAELQLPTGVCRILNVSALIRAKEAMGRPHDLLTVAQLKAIQERQG